MLLALLTAVIPAGLPSVGPIDPADPAVRLWINNNRRFRPGEPALVQVETGANGYLLVLQYDPEGEVRVLFPLGPADDGFVEANRRFELREDDHDQSFVANGTGSGLIYAAISAEPFRFDGFVVAGSWDLGAIRIARDSRDPEADLTELVQRMSSSRGFDYDVLDYAVAASASRVYYANPPSWWSPGYYDDRYYDDWYYDGWYDPWGCYWCRPYRSSFFVHIGIGSPYWYWPTYWYRPWYYHSWRPHGYYPPYWGFRSHNPVVVIPRGSFPSIVGRARGYQVQPGRPRGGNGFDRGFDRSGEGGRAIPASTSQPPARRARGERGSSGGNVAGRPSGESTGRSAGRPSGGGDRGSSAGRQGGGGSGRARGGSSGRARGGSGGGNESAVQVPEPQIERSRPERAGGREWVRMDNPSPQIELGRSERARGEAPANRPEARRTERADGGSISVGRPRGERVGTNGRGGINPAPTGSERRSARSIERPPARRAEPAERGGGGSVERVYLGDGSGGQRVERSRGGGAPMPQRVEPRSSSAPRAGGARMPQRVEPRGSSAPRASAPARASAGGGGGGSRGAVRGGGGGGGGGSRGATRGGGGGGRSRGRGG
ncbi:MAG TPA: DUF4384 domain-containing protein [Gemmatimonadales bacterium]